MFNRIIVLWLVIVFLSSCETDQNTIGILGEGLPQVTSDGNGNFMAVWKSGESIQSRYYEQSSGQPVVRLGYGLRPKVAMSSNGTAFASWYSKSGARKHTSYIRRFDAQTGDWDATQDSLQTYSLFASDEQWDPEIVVTGDTAFMTMAWQLGQREILSSQ